MLTYDTPGYKPIRAALAAAVVCLAAVVPTAARAESEHRAAVVVDTGAEVRIARITFTTDSISGVEALELAGMDPVVRGYGGQGAAVCALCGRGCPADTSCLTCGGADYWAYFRAVGGASGYTYSPVGAGATRVHDGDVEAWKWGPGVPPAFHSFAEIWGESPTTTTATTSPPAPTSAPPTSAAPGTTAAPTATTSPTAAAAPTAGVSAAGGSDDGGTTEGAGGGTAGGTAAPTAAPGAASEGGGSGGTAAEEDSAGSRSAAGDSDDPAAESPPAPTAPTAPGSPDPALVRAAPTALDTPAGAQAGPEEQPVAVAPLLSSRDAGGSWSGVVAFAVVAAGLGGWILWSRRRAAAPPG